MKHLKLCNDLVVSDDTAHWLRANGYLFEDQANHGVCYANDTLRFLVYDLIEKYVSSQTYKIEKTQVDLRNLSSMPDSTQNGIKDQVETHLFENNDVEKASSAECTVSTTHISESKSVDQNVDEQRLPKLQYTQDTVDTGMQLGSDILNNKLAAEPVLKETPVSSQAVKLSPSQIKSRLNGFIK